MADKEFYIVLRKEDGVVTGHAIKSGEIDKEFVDGLFAEKPGNSEEQENGRSKIESDDRADVSPFPKDFLAVEKVFARAMSMYRSSVVETIKLAPMISGVISSRGIEKIANERGSKVAEYCSEMVDVFLLPEHSIYAISKHVDRSRALIEGAMHLPKISTIGIISSYDAILADLLRVIFSAKPDIVFTSDREVKFSDLVSYGSIDLVKESIIANEIEGVLRQSHHEQFAWMERKFTMKLREDRVTPGKKLLWAYK